MCRLSSIWEPQTPGALRACQDLLKNPNPRTFLCVVFDSKQTICMKDVTAEPHALTEILNFCYQPLIDAVIWFLQFVELIISIEFLL
jgi:hypothetical protein